jgi:hypothetical protein
MSRGINVYDQVRASFGNDRESQELLARFASKPPRIFLSHKSEDKSEVKAVGEYIKNACIDIYLDADDPELQKAVRERDDVKITWFIERGVAFSTDVMAFISRNTQGSWWVPYEFGFGKSLGRGLASLELKYVANAPSFLKIAKQIKSIDDLNEYVKQVKARNPGSRVITEAQDRTNYSATLANSSDAIIMAAHSSYHPLDAYLNK